MAFIQEELRNYSLKGWQGVLGTGNRSTAPDNSTYYEEAFANSLSIAGSSVLTSIDLVPPASNQTIADANVTANPTIIRGFGSPANPANAIHLTPTPNQKGYMCTSVHGDMSTRLKNFIQPQMIQNGNFASTGYTARLYQGDPNAGGVEIPTTTDQVGADVGWFFMYGAGAVIVSSTFSGITNPNDVWLICYQYIGPTSASTSSTPISAGISITMDKPNSYSVLDNQKIRPKMAPKSFHVGGHDIRNIPSCVHNTGGITIPAGTNLYLADAINIDDYGFQAVYRGFNLVDGYEMTVPKRFPQDAFLNGIPGVPLNARDVDLAPLGFEIEVWVNKDLLTNNRAGYTSHGQGRRMIRKALLTRNLILFEDLYLGARSGIYSFKLRDLNQGTEAWLSQKISLKKFPIITTDSTLSADVAHGHFISARVV